MSNPYHKANGEFASRDELSSSIDDAVARNDANTYLTERSILEAPVDKKAQEEFFVASNNTSRDDEDDLPTHDALLTSSKHSSQSLSSREQENVRKQTADAEEAQQKANEQAQKAQQEHAAPSVSQQEPEVEEEWEMSW